jgi:hypothetical protein
MDAIWHKVSPNPRLDPMAQVAGVSTAWMGELFVGGECIVVDMDTGESWWEGGVKVATIYRRTEDHAIGECIRLSSLVPAMRS